MAKTTATPTAPRLKALYSANYTKELQAELGLDNVHQVPKLEKIVVSVGIGKNKDDKHHYEVVRNTVTKITSEVVCLSPRAPLFARRNAPDAMA